MRPPPDDAALVEPALVEPVVGAGGLAALGVRDYRWFWFAALVSNSGSWMQSAAIPFVIFSITGSSADVGITGFAVYAPMVLVSLIGGSVADRFDRRRMLAVTQVAQAACSMGLWLVVESGSATALSVSAVGFLSGLAGGFNIPIWQAFVAELVPRDLLANAVVLNSTQFNAGRALGPLLAGIVIAQWSASAAFALNAASFVAVLAVLPFISGRYGEAGDRRAQQRPSLWLDLKAGALYVWHSPPLRACCVAIMVVSGLGNPLFSYLPATYGQEVFAVGGWRLGLLSGVGGVGAVLVAPLLLTRSAAMSRRALLGLAMTGYGVGALVVGLAPGFWVAIAGGLVWGGSYLAIATAMNTTMQLVARDDMRGKAIAIYVTCLTAALPLGTLAWGLVADQVGIRTTTVGAAVGLLALTAWSGLGGGFSSLETVDIGG